MGRKYGIEICVNALEKLSSASELRERIRQALGELKVMKIVSDSDGDLSIVKRKEIENIDTEFQFIDKNDKRLLENISRRIVGICTGIIVENCHLESEN
jgi:hypothetical protein